MPLKPWIAPVVAGIDVPEAEMRAAMDTIMEGKATDAQIGAFLIALRMKGETTDEIAGAAAAMRARVTRVKHRMPRVLDTCGTGGDGANTFNISTAVAFVAAGAGVVVAKHGNRAVSSRSGSADVLEALGVRIDLPPERATQILREIGFAFLFAQSHHPAMKHVGPARKQLGVRTIMNLLGPLTNPAGATHQLVGVYDGERIASIAEVLGRLGAKRAVVVHGDDGLDEVSPCAPSRVAVWKDGRVTSHRTSPMQFGFDPVKPAMIEGGDAQENARVIRSVLDGKHGAARTTVLLNAAWALFAAELCDDPKQGLALARQSIDDGAAYATLESLIEATNA
ncbi:MAG: anthranilate phosphoribosyltransferase [Myxococcota bacterium]